VKAEVSERGGASLGRGVGVTRLRGGRNPATCSVDGERVWARVRGRVKLRVATVTHGDTESGIHQVYVQYHHAYNMMHPEAPEGTIPVPGTFLHINTQRLLRSTAMRGLYSLVLHELSCAQLRREGAWLRRWLPGSPRSIIEAEGHHTWLVRVHLAWDDPPRLPQVFERHLEEP